jgi:hypothetical protein
MKKLIFPVTCLLIIAMIACTDNTESNLLLSNGFNIQIGSKIVLNTSNIDYYDHSAHYIYLIEGAALDLSMIDESKFWVLGRDKQFVYEGIVDPFNYNSNSVFWSNQGFLFLLDNPGKVLKLVYNNDFREIAEGAYDPRNDNRIIEALKADGLYHCGLSCEIDTVFKNPENGLTLRLKLINNDSFNYYYLDPGKMEFKQYHYFTNGLSLYQWVPFASYHNNVMHVVPEMSPCCWGEDWVSLIRSGETKILELTYDQFDEFPSGRYCAVFRFHGEMIRPVAGSTIFENGRMWLGDIQIAQNVTIE